ncbi:MAG: radical SAM protein [Bacteroidetes bacterium 4484_276]|nr:MAG: radical SAM protein [Bacteroidetes bacterium 4484_276]
MYDQFKRKINYLRISVTDRCNLRCMYCMPAEGIKMVGHEEILSFDEIVEVTKVAVSMGIDKVRITGGEPLVRKGIVDLMKMIAGIDGIKDLAMTTNGILLHRFARPLADAGLHRVNISLDTLDPDTYYKITRLGNIDDVFRGIKAAKQAGLKPIKINCVIKKSSDEPDAQAVKKFALENNLKVRFIPEMNLETGSFSVVEGGDGGNCKICNRLRLTATGKIKPCLFSDIEFDVRELGPEAAINLALGNKPQSGTVNHVDQFHNIGG